MFTLTDKSGLLAFPRAHDAVTRVTVAFATSAHRQVRDGVVVRSESQEKIARSGVHDSEMTHEVKIPFFNAFPHLYK